MHLQDDQSTLKHFGAVTRRIKNFKRYDRVSKEGFMDIQTMANDNDLRSFRQLHDKTEGLANHRKRLNNCRQLHSYVNAC